MITFALPIGEIGENKTRKSLIAMMNEDKAGVRHRGGKFF